LLTARPIGAVVELLVAVGDCGGVSPDGGATVGTRWQR
jgi:hypothetical protein